jgi:hypothetical protein
LLLGHPALAMEVLLEKGDVGHLVGLIREELLVRRYVSSRRLNI